jgi:hypothetical protein
MLTVNPKFFVMHDTLGVNFINVKRATFTYERLFSSYVLALNKLSYKKYAKNVDEIEPRRTEKDSREAF